MASLQLIWNLRDLVNKKRFFYEDKLITILPNSGHDPVETDFNLRNNTILDFVKKYQ